MSKIPQIKRLVTEDFQEQKSWINKLFLPLNTFMESVFSALNKNLTITDNMAAEVKVVQFSSVPSFANPLPLSWTLNRAPTAIVVANAQLVTGANFVLTQAVTVQWAWTATGLQITNLLGVTPTSSNLYNVTLVIFTG